MTQTKRAAQGAKKTTAKGSRRRKTSTSKPATRGGRKSPRSTAAFKNATPPRSRSAGKPKETKSEQVLSLLCRKDGATLAELMSATGWQAHSVRGFLSGTVRKRLNCDLRSATSEGGRRYWIEGEASTGGAF